MENTDTSLVETSGAPPVAPPVDLDAVRLKLRAIKCDIGAAYMGRAEMAEALVAAVLTKQHVLAFGRPGGAKSAVLDAFLASLTDASRWRFLLTKQTDESEVFGPYSIKALRDRDAYQRNVTGRLADVNFAFLDETFKATGGLLNSLLTAMNEREYHSASIPLWSVVGASNELGEDESTAALWDRFLFRVVADWISDDDDFDRLLEKAEDESAAWYVPRHFITLAELHAAAVAVRAVKVPLNVRQEIVRVRRALATAGLEFSDRRWVQCLRVVKAAAWLDDCAVAEPEHVASLKNCLWNRPEDLPKVVATLATIDRGVSGRAVEIIDEALRAWASRPSDKLAYLDQAETLRRRLLAAARKVKTLVGDAPSKRVRAKVGPKMAEMAQIAAKIAKDLADAAAVASGSGFSLDPK